MLRGKIVIHHTMILHSVLRRNSNPTTALGNNVRRRMYHIR
jgi:hypothetical protein